MPYIVDNLIQLVAESDATFTLRVQTYINDQHFYWNTVGGSFTATVGNPAFIGYPPISPTSDTFEWDSVNLQFIRNVTFSYENTYYYKYLGISPAPPSPPPFPIVGDMVIFGSGGTLVDSGLAFDMTAMNWTNLAPATLAGQAVEFSQLSGVGTVTNVATAGLISGGPITTTGTVTTSMNTNRLVGRGTAGAGIMEEIVLGTNLSLTGTTLNATGGSVSPLTTKGDLYTYDTTNARLPVGLNTQILLADSSTATGLKWGTNTAATPLGYYGAFEDNTIQTAAAINTPYAMKFGITDLSNGITIVSDGSNLTRITIANTGVYNIQFSAQFDRTNSGTDSVDIWLRKNGVDVPGSGGKIILTGGAAASAIIAAWNYVLNTVGGDYYQLMWSTPDTHVRLLYEAAQTSPFAHPIIPSVILTVTQQSGIMAGTGITAINSLTGAAQTMVAGTSGTDFAVSSLGTTHTLNLPSSSALNRGALTAADWTTFNNKGNGTVTNVTGTSPVVSSGGTTPAISMPAATGGISGYLSGTDWSTFNNKGSGTVTSVAATVPTFLSVAGSPITTSGTLAVTLSGTALPVLNGGTGVTTSTGSGNTVLSTSPTLVTPILGSASATALTFSSTAVSGLTINKLTTAQRQALTPTSGDVVYDTTIGTTCTYNGTFWDYTIFKKLTSDFSTTSVTNVSITGFTFPVEANSTYLVEGVWMIGTSSITGYTIGNNLVAGASSYSFYFSPTTSGFLFQNSSNINGAGSANYAQRFISTSGNIKFNGFLVTVATAGNVDLQIRSASVANTITVLGGTTISGTNSYATFKKIA